MSTSEHKVARLEHLLSQQLRSDYPPWTPPGISTRTRESFAHAPSADAAQGVRPSQREAQGARP
jgi:hypothetical protein